MLAWNESTEEGVGEGGLPGNDDWRGARGMIPSVGASAFTGRFPPNTSKPDVIPACGTGLANHPDYADIPCTESPDSERAGQHLCIRSEQTQRGSECGHTRRLLLSSSRTTSIRWYGGR